MRELRKLPNIGVNLEEKLVRAGIRNLEDLKNAGSREAFIRVRNLDNDGCFSMLCALEGAIQGVRWHDLSEEVKRNLKKFYASVD